MESEYILHNNIAFAITAPKIIKISNTSTKLWQKQFWLFFFWDTVYISF